MALGKCRECGTEVSTDAKTCPHCGARRPVKSNSGWWALGIMAAAFVGFAVWANSPPGPSSTPLDEIPAADVQPAVRCYEVSARLREMTASTLTVQGGAGLGQMAAAKSGAHHNAYYVAGQITGPGMDDAVGVWATNRLDGTGLVFSVDAMAREFSDAGDGRRTDAAFSMSDPGATESRGCLDALAPSPTSTHG